jgi:hypothetical protein
MALIADDVRLAQYRGSNPVLLLFTPSGDHPLFTTQLEWLRAAGPALQGQGLVLVEAREELVGSVEGRPLGMEAVRHLRRDLRAPVDRFLAVLLGLDGQPLVRSGRPVPAEELARALGEGAGALRGASGAPGA